MARSNDGDLQALEASEGAGGEGGVSQGLGEGRDVQIAQGEPGGLHCGEARKGLSGDEAEGARHPLAQGDGGGGGEEAWEASR